MELKGSKNSLFESIKMEGVYSEAPLQALYHANYVDQCIPLELDLAALRVLTSLRFCETDRRMYCSMKECARILPETKLLLVAPDVTYNAACNRCPVRSLRSLLHAALCHGVPFVFCMSRSSIGRIFGRTKQISVVALVDVHGYEEDICHIMTMARECRQYFYDHVYRNSLI